MMHWKYKEKDVKSLKDVPKDAIGFVYLLTVESNGKKHLYIGKKNFFSVTNPEISYKKYLELRKKDKNLVRRTKNKQKSRKNKIVWRYKMRDQVTESNWKSYESSSRAIGLPHYKVVKKEIIEYCFDERELKYKEAKEIVCSGALESDYYLNKGVSLRMFLKDNYE